MLTRRASTSCSTSRACASSTATLARGTRARTGSPSSVGITRRSSRLRSWLRWASSIGVVQRLRRLGHRVPDPAGGPVAVDGQGRALAPFPGLAQHVREHRQRGRLALDLADQQVDQPRLEPQPGAAGGALDRAAQVRLAHRAEQVEAVLQDPRDVRVRRQVAEVVRPQREDQRAAGAHVGGQRGEVPLPLGGVRAQR